MDLRGYKYARIQGGRDVRGADRTRLHVHRRIPNLSMFEHRVSLRVGVNEFSGTFEFCV